VSKYLALEMVEKMFHNNHADNVRISHKEIKMSKRNIVHIEIPSDNVDRSGKFYSELFDWKITSVPEMDYTMWEPEVAPGGGFILIDEHKKVSHILIYVDSSDITADLKRVVELGGTVVTHKSEIPGTGWFGVFKDPTGNMIALFTSMDSNFNK
jgi:predicted enzyme related to lactoylglutathione lyase